MYVDYIWRPNPSIHVSDTCTLMTMKSRSNIEHNILLYQIILSVNPKLIAIQIDVLKNQGCSWIHKIHRWKEAWKDQSYSFFSQLSEHSVCWGARKPCCENTINWSRYSEDCDNGHQHHWCRTNFSDNRAFSSKNHICHEYKYETQSYSFRFAFLSRFVYG